MALRQQHVNHNTAPLVCAKRANRTCDGVSPPPGDLLHASALLTRLTPLSQWSGESGRGNAGMLQVFATDGRPAHHALALTDHGESQPHHQKDTDSCPKRYSNWGFRPGVYRKQQSICFALQDTICRCRRGPTFLSWMMKILNAFWSAPRKWLGTLTTASWMPGSQGTTGLLNAVQTLKKSAN